MATLIVGLFNSLVGIVATFASVMTALRVAMYATLAIFIAFLYVTAKACHDVVCGPVVAGAAALHPMVGMGFGLVFNSKTVGIFGCYLTVWMACELFTHRKTFMVVVLGKL